MSYLRKFGMGLVLALSSWLTNTGTALAVPVVELRASSEVIAVGDALRLDLVARDFEDLFAFQFSLGFTQRVVNATSAMEGDFLSNAGTTFFIPGVFDNDLGQVSFAANTLIGPISGSTGDGLLASFLFGGGVGGIATFTLSDVLFLDSSLNPLEVALAGTSVLVNDAQGVPEPSALMLLAIGFGVLVTGARRAGCNMRV